jgi:hypothetical protein
VNSYHLGSSGLLLWARKWTFVTRANTLQSQKTFLVLHLKTYLYESPVVLRITKSRIAWLAVHVGRMETTRMQSFGSKSWRKDY